MTSLLLFSITSGVAAQTTSATSGDFKSDNCTMFPDGNYAKCCVAHDEDYSAGGSGKDRRASDRRLYRCVRSKKGWQNEIAAPVMYLGVRVFGVSWLPTRFRWGFGRKRG